MLASSLFASSTHFQFFWYHGPSSSCSFFLCAACVVVCLADIIQASVNGTLVHIFSNCPNFRRLIRIQ